MIILVNDIAASCGGALTVLTQFYEYIKANDVNNTWIFLLSDNYFEETENIHICVLKEIKKSRLKKVLFDLFMGKLYIERFHPDVVVSLQNIISFGVDIPQIVYIHQSIPFQNELKFSLLKKNERNSAFVQYFVAPFIQASIKRATHIIVQTEWMKHAVSSKMGISAQKISAILPEIEKYKINGERFNKMSFFYPTNSEAYKNIDLIKSACEVLNSRGITDFEVYITTERKVVKHPNIHCVGVVPKEQMGNMYKKNTLLFPSRLETVGLPLLEARECGTLIVACDLPYAHECLDGYPNAFFIQPFDSTSLADLMQGIIEERITPIVINEKEQGQEQIPGWKRMCDVIYARGEVNDDR